MERTLHPSDIFQRSYRCYSEVIGKFMGFHKIWMTDGGWMFVIEIA